MNKIKTFEDMIQQCIEEAELAEAELEFEEEVFRVYSFKQQYLDKDDKRRKNYLYSRYNKHAKPD